MSTLSIVLICLLCVLIGLDGANAAIQFEHGNTGGGFLWTICAVLWTAVIILRVVNPT